MPEGDSAWRAAHHLGRALADRTVERFELRVPAHATADLRGERIAGADARGKHVLLRIGRFTVHSHFGMDGSWRLVPPGEQDAAGRVAGAPPPLTGRTAQRGAASSGSQTGPGAADNTSRARRGAARSASQARPGAAGSASRARPSARLQRGPSTGWPAAHRIRAIIGTDAVIALGIDLAVCDLWPTADEHRHLGHLGPDLLTDAPDLDEAARRILAEPDRPITGALLDQRNVAGLGNEYVTEMCFLRGALPSRTVAEAGDIGEWLALGRRLLLANRDRVERTFTGDLHDGAWVFGREGLPCKRCGAIIEAGEHDSGYRGAERRDSSWCPHCQR